MPRHLGRVRDRPSGTVDIAQEGIRIPRSHEGGDGILLLQEKTILAAPRRNVQSIALPGKTGDRDSVLGEVEKLLLSKGLATKDDMIVVTWGDPMGQIGGTNALKITKIGGR